MDSVDLLAVVFTGWELEAGLDRAEELEGHAAEGSSG